jgi:hypothetical protein
MGSNFETLQRHCDAEIGGSGPVVYHRRVLWQSEIRDPAPFVAKRAKPGRQRREPDMISPCGRVRCGAGMPLLGYA